MSDPIKHVILLMLENHSFDQMLGDLKEKTFPQIEGVDRKNPKSNPDGNGNVVLQGPTTEKQMIHDPWHETRDVMRQLEGENSGFVKDFLFNYPGAKQNEQEAIMGYYPMGSLPAIHQLAANFTVCDHWFSSLPGPTWPNRFFALTGTSMGFVKMPEHHKDFRMLTNQTQDTIFDRFNEADPKVSWNIFYYDFPCSLILKRMREPKKRSNYKKIEEFFSMCQGKESDFPQFAFIEPKFDGFDQNDDHPPHNVMKAQKLIADVYNAIRGNEDLWNNSLLIVLYDEHGGFYDHVIPPEAPPPDDHNDEYTFDRLGVRVPAVLISPWVKAGVETTEFDHTSILKYLSEKWHLGSLTKRVDWAHSIGKVIQPTMRKDALPTSIRISFTDTISKHPELELTDLSKHHVALLGAVEQLVEEAASHAGGKEIEVAGLDLGRVVLRLFYSAQSKFYRLQARLGSYVIAFGHRMIAPHRNRRKDLVENATRILLGG